jgi:hypothetical protein
VANPARFIPSYDFSDFESTQPNTPKPGVQLDSQFDDISDSTTQLRDAIIDIRRSDGALVNGIVTEDSLEDGLLETLTAATGSAAITTAAAAITVAQAEVEAAAVQLAAVAEIIEAGGFFGDYGSITEAPGQTLDYGSIA